MSSVREAFDSTTADINSVFVNFRNILINYENKVAELIDENKRLKEELSMLKAPNTTTDTTEEEK